MGKKNKGTYLGWDFIVTDKDIFRVEFYNAIIGSSLFESITEAKLESSLFHKLRFVASKSKFIKYVYKFVRRPLRLTFSRFQKIKGVNYEQAVSTLNKDLAQKPKFYLVVPYFLEMNGPESHYGDLLYLAKSLGFEVSYVATERSELNSSDSAFDAFEDVRLFYPEQLSLLSLEKSVIVNCGSPWIYRNLEWINSSGGMVIDFLFNHVGHTRMNLLKRNLLFSTVCQHRKLYEILSETSVQNDSLFYIPIPFPTPDIKIIEYKDKSGQPLWIGRLSSEKGVDRLVELAYAFNLLSGGSIKVIGNGPLKGVIRQAVLSGVIEWQGDLSLRETLIEISKHKVVINTSYIEGLSLVAMEALSLEAKFIGLDVGGMSELTWNPNAIILPRETNATSFAQCIISTSRENHYLKSSVPHEFTNEFRNLKWKEVLDKAILFAK